MTCDAKIRPFPGPSEIQCEGEASHDGNHSGVLRDYAGHILSATTLVWQEGDRRTFRGEWRPCDSPGCVLPADHWGRHAQ